MNGDRGGGGGNEPGYNGPLNNDPVPGEQGVGGSNPLAPTSIFVYPEERGSRVIRAPALFIRTPSVRIRSICLLLACANHCIASR